MKSSQKIAEDYAFLVGINHFGEPDEMINESLEFLQKEILQEIPLVQLIEVARAAMRSTGTGKVKDEVELFRKLQALKQTRKAEWL